MVFIRNEVKLCLESLRKYWKSYEISIKCQMVKFSKNIKFEISKILLLKVVDNLVRNM